MQLIIKVLKGEGCRVNVNINTKILEIKKEIQKLLGIPIGSQKLLIMGHTLKDDKPLSAYPNIKDGTKINLFVKKEERLRGVICRQFRKYYSDQVSERLTKEFIKDFEKKLAAFSLEDIERLSEVMRCH